MKVEILGRREDQRLEFKSKAALEDPGGIARSVVGMLNAEGGEIWIGVEDHEDLATAVEPVADPERAKARLLDHLVDAVDPSPTPQELSVEVVPSGANPGILVVKIEPSREESGRRPYAFRKRGGWHFLRRIGARSHPMSRQEIFGRAVQGRNDEIVTKGIRALEKERQVFRDSGGTGLWFGMAPARRLDLAPDDPLFEQIVLSPSRTGNRSAGWHFARASNRPRPTKDGMKAAVAWEHRSEIRGKNLSQVCVNETGMFRGSVALERLHRKGEEHEIWPITLLEYPVSAFRIARVLYRDHLQLDDAVVADLALFGVAGWKLREGTPDEFFLANDLAQIEEPDLVWESVVFPFREIDEVPDRCGFRLVRRVYHAFGWRESDMPQQYDRKTGRLILPE